MAKPIVPLSDSTVKNAKATTKPIKLFDGGGLFLLVNPSGGKYWRLKYRIGGKEKTLALGIYPAISLGKARKRREEAREQVEHGIDPGEMKKQKRRVGEEKAINTFEKVAREWHQKNYRSWVPSHGDQILRRMELDIFPAIGNRPIADLKPVDLLAALRGIEKRGSIETAHRVKQNCGQVFRYAVATGRAERDISADLRGALAPVIKGHHAAITDPDALAGLLRAIDGFEGTFVVKSALRLSPLIFSRPGEIRKAEWAELDLDAAEWNLPASRMKMKVAHLVPLSTQAVDILRELQSLTGGGRYLFPCIRSVARPMSNNAVNAALRRMGFTKEEMTWHGFRATARTILDEVLHFRPDIIEHQTAHAVRDPNGRAYNRTQFLVERKAMMQKWANYLDDLKDEGKAIPVREKVSQFCTGEQHETREDKKTLDASDNGV